MENNKNNNQKDIICYLDIKIDGQQAQRIEIVLFYDIVPKTCENFKQLCTGEKGKGVRAKQLQYKNSKLHRIIPNFIIQGGDIIYGDGRGQESIYGLKFNDENFTIKHTQKYQVGMINNGPNSNGSQFYITLDKCSHMDGKFVAFGEVIRGQNVIDEIEKLGQQSGIPQKQITIVDSGIL